MEYTMEIVQDYLPCLLLTQQMMVLFILEKNVSFVFHSSITYMTDVFAWLDVLHNSQIWQLVVSKLESIHWKENQTL